MLNNYCIFANTNNGDNMLDNTIDKIIENVSNILGYSPDLSTRIIKKGKYRIGYMFFDSVSSDDKISNFLNKSLVVVNKKNIFDSLYTSINNTIFNSNIKTCDTYERIIYYLASGFTIVIFDNEKKAIVIETRETLDRGVSESTSEVIVRGPKDSFTENHNKNIGLIRKRIKDSNLWFKSVEVGNKTKTIVSICYMNDIVPKEKIDKLYSDIKDINIDGIFDSGYIRELLEKKQSSAFPKVISTERPDLASTSLLSGKIVILVENSPFAIILPAVLNDFFKSPEDNYKKPLNVSFSRLLRLLCFFITLFIPAIYIALMTYNPEIIPDKLLISLAIQREAVPFPTTIEILIFITTFEILREANIHSSANSSGAMNIVGALILGDAAVAAGIVSPIVIIIVAATAISELVFYDVDVIDAIREWRIFFIAAATFMGITGLILSVIIFIAKLSSLECLGVAYLTPFSPLKIKNLKDSIIRVSRKKIKNNSKLVYLKGENK